MKGTPFLDSETPPHTGSDKVIFHPRGMRKGDNAPRRTTAFIVAPPPWPLAVRLAVGVHDFRHRAKTALMTADRLRLAVHGTAIHHGEPRGSFNPAFPSITTAATQVRAQSS